MNKTYPTIISLALLLCFTASQAFVPASGMAAVMVENTPEASPVPVTTPEEQNETDSPQDGQAPEQSLVPPGALVSDEDYWPTEEEEQENQEPVEEQTDVPVPAAADALISEDDYPAAEDEEQENRESDEEEETQAPENSSPPAETGQTARYFQFPGGGDQGSSIQRIEEIRLTSGSSGQSEIILMGPSPADGTERPQLTIGLDDNGNASIDIRTAVSPEAYSTEPSQSLTSAHLFGVSVSVENGRLNLTEGQLAAMGLTGEAVTEFLSSNLNLADGTYSFLGFFESSGQLRMLIPFRDSDFPENAAPGDSIGPAGDFLTPLDNSNLIPSLEARSAVINQLAIAAAVRQEDTERILQNLGGLFNAPEAVVTPVEDFRSRIVEIEQRRRELLPDGTLPANIADPQELLNRLGDLWSDYLKLIEDIDRWILAMLDDTPPEPPPVSPEPEPTIEAPASQQPAVQTLDTLVGRRPGSIYNGDKLLITIGEVRYEAVLSAPENSDPANVTHGEFTFDFSVSEPAFNGTVQVIVEDSIITSMIVSPNGLILGALTAQTTATAPEELPNPAPAEIPDDPANNLMDPVFIPSETEVQVSAIWNWLSQNADALDSTRQLLWQRESLDMGVSRIEGTVTLLETTPPASRRELAAFESIYQTQTGILNAIAKDMSDLVPLNLADFSLNIDRMTALIAELPPGRRTHWNDVLTGSDAWRAYQFRTNFNASISEARHKLQRLRDRLDEYRNLQNSRLTDADENSDEAEPIV